MLGMAKLTLAFALISTLFIININASVSYRTTIATIEIDDSSDGKGDGSMSQQCRTEVQKRDLSSCMQYLMPEQSEQEESQHLQKCCNQVKQVKNKCQCDAIESVLQDLLQQGKIYRHRYPKTLRKTFGIPSECGLPQQCQFRPNNEEEEPSNQQNPSECQTEAQKRDMSSCEEYILPGDKSESQKEESQNLEQCCNQVKQVRNECRCDVIKSVFHDLQGRMMRDEYPSALIKTSLLPKSCGLPQKYCSIRANKKQENPRISV